MPQGYGIAKNWPSSHRTVKQDQMHEFPVPAVYTMFFYIDKQRRAAQRDHVEQPVRPEGDCGVTELLP